MAAILAQQQQQQQPSVPPGFHTPSPGPAGLLDNGSSDAGGGSTAVLVGAIVAGVLGAAALVGAAGAILWYVRRRSSGAAQSSLQLDASTGQPKCAVGLDSSSGRGASLQEHAAAQQDGKASRLADYSEHATLMSLTDRDGHGSVETAAATSGNRQDPAGIQAQGSENSNRMLPDLVIHASPFREGLSTNLVVLVPLRGTPTTAGGGVSLPRTPAAAAPASVSSASRPSSGARSFGGSSAAQNGAGGSAPPGIQKEAGGAAAAGQRQARPSSAAAACGAGGSDRGTIYVSAGNEPEITRRAAAYASKVAAMLLHTSSDVDSLLHIAYGSGLRPLAAGTPVAAGAAGMEAAAGAAHSGTAMPVNAEAMAGMRAVGTPAAAVSLLPLPEACEEQNVQVEVVELLPIKLGRGSFGRVQEGRYRGQRVAVKQALDQHDGLSMPTGKLVASFLQEVEVMGRCDHPNICKLLAACLAPPKLCLVMELMDTSLESLIKGQTPGQLLPLPKLLHIAIQVAQGLEYLHPTVLHRDLKPANVLISNPESGTPIVKLTDFGLSKITEMTLQTANAEAGTPAYMAPECFDVTNDKLTHKVDMYAFGVILWAMLTGEEPWKGYPLVSVAYSVHCGRRLPLDDIPDSRCPRKMRKLVEQCWEPTPRRRPAAAEAVKELLLLREQLLTDGAAPSSTEIS
ncbi:hypothetical protein CHLRE_03g159016v5 [Chlamydomonas reinhardtii]|nr:uncharacterized protein CHLRE_03g159016v5 [Chlamydomonas reinhardtii]PNW84796.1 hypothetical protein CHLRE_03g159016v5 [Chlamydomonas reinhardtii]